jgi:hypothetical protein
MHESTHHEMPALSFRFVTSPCVKRPTLATHLRITARFHDFFALHFGICFVALFFPGTNAGLITLFGFLLRHVRREVLVSFPWLCSCIFCRLSTQYTPYDVTPVTNIIATTTRWDKQLTLMVDVMRAAAALFLSVRQGGC